MKLLLASGNPKKRGELERMLAPLGVELLTPAQVGGLPEVIEDQDSFRGNAAKKALSATRASGLPCLADDSGLEVEALGGAPGVRSARFAGEPCDDAANNAKLLQELAQLPEASRRARFVCALALALPGGTGEARLAAEFEGQVRGRILDAARGAGGFGYDPLFLFDEPGEPGSGQAFGELSADQKALVSHRGRALEQLLEELPKLLHCHTSSAD